MEICHLSKWEKYILDYARSEDCDGSKIKIPSDIAKAMWIDHTPTTEYIEVDQKLYRNMIFEQGHVSNLILLYAIAGREYDKVRLDLTMCLMDYTTSSIPYFTEWKDAAWLDEIYFEKIATFRSLLPLITKWIRHPYTSDDYKKFQYILPVYLLLGDYTKIPDSRRELRMCMYDVIAGTNFIGDSTWQDVYYDISRSGKVFRSMVKHADRFFDINKDVDSRTLFEKIIQKSTVTPKRIFEDVGNWLAFGAYITLLSKYQRYTLNADGFNEARVLIAKEASKLFLQFREKLG